MSNAEKNQHQGTQSVIKKVVPLLTPPWPTLDPFLFCVHHDDQYPAGDTHMAPKASLKGRHIGSDFSGLNGWSMYHGDRIPGFARHPHRGFETITLARQGYIDHSDSMGATARFGKGDVQWMTAGKGVVHSEMFPLVNESSENPTELFQIWINLPKKDKFKSPYFTMFWSEELPKVEIQDRDGHTIELTVIAGEIPLHKGQTLTPPPPPPTVFLLLLLHIFFDTHPFTFPYSRRRSIGRPRGKHRVATSGKKWKLLAIRVRESRAK